MIILFFSLENEILQNPRILAYKFENFRLSSRIRSKFSEMRNFDWNSWTWNQVYCRPQQDVLDFQIPCFRSEIPALYFRSLLTSHRGHQANGDNKDVRDNLKDENESFKDLVDVLRNPGSLTFWLRKTLEKWKFCKNLNFQLFGNLKSPFQKF